MSTLSKNCAKWNSTAIHDECDWMYQAKVCVQEFSYFVSGLDIQLQQFKNKSPVCKKYWLQVAKYNKSCTVFAGNWYKPMAYWLRWVVESQATWIWFPMNFETLCSASAILCGSDISALTCSIFSTAALLIIFFFLDFVSGCLSLT